MHLHKYLIEKCTKSSFLIDLFKALANEYCLVPGNDKRRAILCNGDSHMYIIFSLDNHTSIILSGYQNGLLHNYKHSVTEQSICNVPICRIF